LQTLELIAAQVALGIERKWSEEALQQSNLELEQRVQVRTRELTHSLSELRDKTDELRMFAHQAAHDLKKPLISLVNWPEKLAVLYGGKGDEKFDDWINKTIAGAKRMRRLIEEGIEPYSEYLKHQDELPSVNCTVVVNEALSNLKGDVEASGATIEIAGDLPTVTGNPSRLMLLFQNLISNAIKYRQPGRPLRIEIGSKHRENGWHFWVRDNGMGIEPKFYKKIFQLGERLHGDSKIPGTGFGLYICERIVAGRGGRMRVRSQLGEGSIFFFTWPTPVSKN
jgi:light-regulated signal transduction histidine kinase (bacteriophytochrome)